MAGETRERRCFFMRHQGDAWRLRRPVGSKFRPPVKDSFHPFDGQHVWAVDEPDERSRFLMWRASSDLFLKQPLPFSPFHSCVSRFGGGRGDEDLVNPIAIHIHDFDLQAFPFKTVGRRRDTP